VRIYHSCNYLLICPILVGIGNLREIRYRFWGAGISVTFVFPSVCTRMSERSSLFTRHYCWTNCDPSQEKLAQVIIKKIAKKTLFYFIFNYFSLIQSLTTLHREDIETWFLQCFEAFFKGWADMQKKHKCQIGEFIVVFLWWVTISMWLMEIS
jgi:hypothetical protein